MIDIEKYAACYFLNRITRGRQSIQEKILMEFVSPENVWTAGRSGEIDYAQYLSETVLEKTDADAFMKESLTVMNRVNAEGTGVVSRYDSDYPALLKECSGSPMLLYYEGKIGDINRCCSRLAVVGSRKCTIYGREMCVKMVSSLAGKDICVVSGLARGIDSFAHKAAVDAGVFTAAVLGCGTNVIYPRENAGLYNRIKENGVIISEQPPDTQPLKQYFPARNRIIAGISEATFAVEAGLSSGALITVNFALDAGRDVLTIPHRIDSPEGAGCNDLLKSGALMITSPRDVLVALGCETEESPEAEVLDETLDKNQREVLGLLKLNGDLFEDEITYETEIESRDVKRALSALEIFGFIKKDLSGRFHAV